MPRKNELTWQAGSGNRQGRWRKKYKGRVLYFAFGRSKSDVDGYKLAAEAWKQEKAAIDAEHEALPKPHQRAYDEVVDTWELLLQWCIENGEDDLGAVARKRLDNLNARLSGAVLPPLKFSDRIESLAAIDPVLLNQFCKKHLASDTDKPLDPKLRTTVVPSPKQLASLDVGLGRIQGAVIQDRIETQRRKRQQTRDNVGALVDSLLAEKRAQVDAGELSAGRYDPLRVHLHHIRDWLGASLPISSITGKVVKNYHSALLTGVANGKWSTHYAHDRMNVLKGFVRWLWRTEAIDALPRILDSSHDLKISKKLTAPSVFTIDEVKTLLGAATDRTRLYLLLMLNTGMQQKDISDLLPSEVDWKRGRITRKRSKTSRHKGVPTVSYPLWKDTFRLLKQERAPNAEFVLLNSDGGRLKVERLDADGKLCKIDNIVSAFGRLRNETGIQKPLKLIRKTSATLLKSGKKFSGVDALFLGHAPRSIADRHYAQLPQALLDEAIKWLGKQFGMK